jgi:23S rRNA (adenine2503-C2)-methyltransferase
MIATPVPTLANPSRAADVAVAEPPRTEALGLTPGGWKTWAIDHGLPGFRGKQVAGWIWGKGVADSALMTNLSADVRQLVADTLIVEAATEAVVQESNDGTIKLLLTWPDGQSAETVMIPDGKRRTACVSSQVGCPVGCRFCASGLAGKQGDLSAGRIVEQAYRLNQILGEFGEKLTNMVFMGMGEPLANYAQVMQALRVLTDPGCMAMSPRRITVSTVGVPGRIRQFAGEGMAANLALSLHAPTEPLRRELIPWADHFGLDDILDACRHYFDETGREITLEYILLGGVNDQPQHAKQLVGVCRGMRANVNLLRYNEVDGLPYKRPAAGDVTRFQDVLRGAGINAHVRRSRGRDIDAACGQLRRNEERRKNEAARRGELVQLGGAA